MTRETVIATYKATVNGIERDIKVLKPIEAKEIPEFMCIHPTNSAWQRYRRNEMARMGH